MLSNFVTLSISSKLQVRRDWLVYAILNSLPWVGRELYDKKEQTVERLMITIDHFMRKRKRNHLNLLRVWSSEDPHPQEEVCKETFQF